MKNVYRAVDNKDNSLLEVMKSDKIAVNSKISNKSKVLYHAVEKANEEAVDLLIKSGANKDLALDYARARENKDAVSLLTSDFLSSAEPKIDSSGNTVFAVMTSNNSPEDEVLFIEAVLLRFKKQVNLVLLVLQRSKLRSIH